MLAADVLFFLFKKERNDDYGKSEARHEGHPYGK